MFFVASKVAAFFILPSHIALLVLCVGLAFLYWRRTARLGRRLAVAGAVVLIVLGFSPAGAWITLPLEERFARTGTPPAQRYAGIIMLGGFEDGRGSAAHNQLSINEAGERFIETVLLAKRHPEAKVIFTGGPASLLLAQRAAGDMVERYLHAFGVPRDRIVIESRSLNTWQNATMTRALVKPAPGEKFLLVTSAWHMPRAMGVFRQVGFNVDAWPVDFRTAGRGDLVRPFSRIEEGLDRVDLATREWIGLVVYYLAGRSSALFPSPHH